jgi:1,4-dihydroxy-2-naphthoyl-CoA hydrolase
MGADGGRTVTGAQPPGAPELDNASAFLAAAGLRLTHVAADRVEGVIDLGPAHHTPWGVVHGGVYTAAVESAASVGATAAVADRGQIAVGTNNSRDEPSNCGTSASPTRAAESSHEERYGCKTSSHDNETEVAAATLRVFDRPVELAEIITEFLTER